MYIKFSVRRMKDDIVSHNCITISLEHYQRKYLFILNFLKFTHYLLTLFLTKYEKRRRWNIQLNTKRRQSKIFGIVLGLIDTEGWGLSYHGTIWKCKDVGVAVNMTHGPAYLLRFSYKWRVGWIGLSGVTASLMVFATLCFIYFGFTDVLCAPFGDIYFLTRSEKMSGCFRPITYMK